eukprot:TRINITY_DN4441_c0_g1_i4.p1 TRINITY_DN4441_c0_g1~~TRINITY_DN4441_c0_g1_i4.p1  ORF type:complete len:469 (+),score=57.34 TRINITY_DN4441_c0_g1_i4:74-1408(+)
MKRQQSGECSSGVGQENKRAKIINQLSNSEVHKIRSQLLEWYDDNCRSLPWRRPPKNLSEYVFSEEQNLQQQHAYGVWVSEVMLQQTQVCTVIDYFNKWMQKWPTIQSLAQATQEEVNEVWAGLGYYRRAKYLLKGSQYVVNDLKGVLPKDKKQLLKIPGIGPYTSGAVASIAFGQPVIAVDGNVNRVASRLATIKGDPKSSQFIHDIEDFASTILCKDRSGDFNQALMELGATVCKPTNPKCQECPLNKNCRAYTTNVVDQFPQKGVQVKKREECILVCIIQIMISSTNLEEDLFIMVQRKEEGLLGGLWEWPNIFIQDKENKFNQKNRELMRKHIKTELKIDFEEDFEIVSEIYVGDRTHIFTHIKQIQVICTIQLKPGQNRENNWLQKVMNKSIEIENSTQKIKLINRQQLKTGGFTTGVRKAYERFLMIEKHNTITRRRW